MHHIVVVVICSETLLSTLSDRLEWYPPQPESGRNPSLIQTQILPDISIIDFGDPPPPSKFDNTLLHLHVSVLITVANYPPAVYFCWIEGRARWSRLKGKNCLHLSVYRQLFLTVYRKLFSTVHHQLQQRSQRGKNISKFSFIKTM